MNLNSTSPLYQSAKLRLDPESGTLRSRQYFVIVESGPDEGQRLKLEGTLFVGSSPDCGLRLTDPTVSRYHLEIQASNSGVRLKDAGSTNGTFVGGARIEAMTVEGDVTLALGKTRLRITTVEENLGKPQSSASSFGRVLGESRPMRELFGLLERAAPTDATVVLLGETGTGKELLAEGVHRASPRKNNRFVTVDCGALAPTLVESELFGHAKGAFTDARTDRAGAFEEATGGTLFLDEIAELPLDLQPKLLRVLDAGTVKRVGENAARKIDVRVVAATHRDLSAEVEAGRFRRDLYFRLAVVIAWVPPLRDRLDDLPLLCRHFIRESGREDFELPPGLLSKLQAHSWPGNVRELRNTIQRAVMGLSADPGSPKPGAHAPTPVPGGLPVPGTVPSPEHLEAFKFKDAKDQIVDAFTRQYLAALIDRCQGNLSEVARVAGINRNHVRRLALKYGLIASE